MVAKSVLYKVGDGGPVAIAESNYCQDLFEVMLCGVNGRMRDGIYCVVDGDGVVSDFVQWPGGEFMEYEDVPMDVWKSMLDVWRLMRVKV